VIAESGTLIADLTVGASTCGASFFFWAWTSAAPVTIESESPAVSSTPKSFFAFIRHPPPVRGVGLPARDEPERPHKLAPRLGIVKETGRRLHPVWTAGGPIRWTPRANRRPADNFLRPCYVLRGLDGTR